MKQKIWSKLVLYSVILLGMVILVISTLTDIWMEKQSMDSHNNIPLSVHLIGQYRVDNGPWIELTKDVKFDLSKQHTVTVQGHFSHEILAGQELMIYNRMLVFTLKVDGNEVYNFGRDKNYPGFLKAPGTTWCRYTSSGISTHAKVELIMQNHYVRTSDVYNVLLDNMKVGSYSQLFMEMFLKEGAILLICVFLSLFGILVFTLAIIVRGFRLPHWTKVAAVSLFPMFTGAWILTSLKCYSLIVPNPAFVNISEVLVIYTIYAAFILVLWIHAGDWLKDKLGIVTAGVCLFITIMIILQLLGVINLWEMQFPFLVTGIPLLVIIVIILAYDAIRFGNNDVGIMLLTFSPSIVGYILETLNFVYNFAPHTLIMNTAFIIVMFLQLIQIIYLIKSGSEEREQALIIEKELTEKRVAIMLSQIQPHFLYNTLTTIENMVYKDKDKASKMISDFSQYLRENMDSLNQRELIPFTKELQHIKIYLDFEKVRFKDYLTIVYNLEVKNFYLPILTVQPLVENAVRHGINKKPEGGTICISTKQVQSDIEIIIEDDGLGFDQTQNVNDGRSHVGLENVRKRLMAQCNGILLIESKIGFGTKVTIRIPVEGSPGGIYSTQI